MELTIHLLMNISSQSLTNVLYYIAFPYKSHLKNILIISLNLSV